MVTSFVSKLVTAITFKKVLIWALAGTIGVIGYTAYENRSDLFLATKLGKGPIAAGNPVGSTFIVGNDTKSKISEFVKNEKSIVGLTVVSVDIRMNTRNQLFFYADKAEKNPPSLEPLTSFIRLPMFTKNDDNNRQMVKLINGEFTCAPYTSGTSLVLAASPKANPDVVTICRASLPPYYGHFSGFVSVLLNTDPDVEEQVRLKHVIEALAIEIYFRDVIPTSYRVKL